MISRAAAVLVTLVVSAGVLSGCVGTPDPVESTPLFASEAEAFAAAEQTYRNYVDALNQVDLSDPATFEPVYAWTTGDLNAQDRKGLTAYHAENANVSGQSRVALVQPGEATTEEWSIAVCLDVSDVTVLDAAGQSLVDLGRTDVQSLEVTATTGISSPTGLQLSSIGAREGGPLCEQ